MNFSIPSAGSPGIDMVLKVALPVAFFGAIALWLGWMEKRAAIATAVGLGVALLTAGIVANIYAIKQDTVGPIGLGAGILVGGGVALFLYRDRIRG